MEQRIGILGGTFNPIHCGHLAAAEEIRNRLHLDRVLLIPSYLPPHKQEEDMPSAVQRLEMVRLAASHNSYLEVSDIEIKRGGKSYTIDTIETLRQADPGAEFFFITGLDSFLDIQAWHCWEKLLTISRFVVISRPGYRFRDLGKLDFLKNAQDDLIRLDQGDISEAVVQSGAFTLYLETIPLTDISSTDIRTRVQTKESIKYLLPEAVETYIIKNTLYG